MRQELYQISQPTLGKTYEEIDRDFWQRLLVKSNQSQSIWAYRFEF